MRSRPSLLELKRYASLIDPSIEPDSNPSAGIDEAGLDYHGVTTLALRNGSLNEPLKSKLAHRIPLAVASEALRSNALEELSTALSKAGLEPLMMKGTALAYQYYPEPWLRPRTDTDLLISPSEYDAYADVFNQLGYQKLFAIEGSLVSYQSTFAKALTNKLGLNIDLHWRISNRQILSQSFSAEELRSRSPRERILGFTSLSLVDHILVACQHRVGHHHREERLTWLYDMHLLLAEFTHADWRLLTELAKAKRIGAITADALTICSEIFKTEIPDVTQTSLRKISAQKEPSSIFLQRELPEWRLFWHELAALPGLRLKFKWCVETLFPSADYMRFQMQESSLFKAHLKRWWRGVKRVLT